MLLFFCFFLFYIFFKGPFSILYFHQGDTSLLPACPKISISFSLIASCLYAERLIVISVHLCHLQDVNLLKESDTQKQISDAPEPAGEVVSLHYHCVERM